MCCLGQLEAVCTHAFATTDAPGQHTVSSGCGAAPAAGRRSILVASISTFDSIRISTFDSLRISDSA
ncbi:hypothetical protein Y1Q_0003983 [Alligator mississippiensis]|uniref:Uncharacterized protein n=1 Tax=Alligator mississippiensis TaxID=8496 RepID=A0A151PHQ3_ALLMI|nr:hypothetical protein Y1Q_0003983 [Alligator mississippiensis]